MFNTIFGYGSGALFVFSAWRMFPPDNGHLDAANYTHIVITACAFVLVTIWLCAFGTLRRARQLSVVAERDARLSPKSLLRDFLLVLRNRNYRFLMMGFFFIMISVGLNETYNIFVSTYFWELKPQQISWYGLVGLPAAIIGALMAPTLMRRFDRRPVLIAALIVMAVFVQLPIDLRLLGLFPENGSPILLPLLLTNFACIILATGVTTVAVLSMPKINLLKQIYLLR